MKTLNLWMLRILSFIVAAVALSNTVTAQDQSAQKANASAKVISGRVTTSDSLSPANARVTIGRSNTSGLFQGQTVRVDSEGNFVSGPLEPGLYIVSVYMPGLIRDPTATAMSPYFRPGDTVDFKMIRGGVITGSVKNADGQGIVAIPVRAIRTRGANGDPLPFQGATRDMMTDDRGIYRIYGLAPGTYIVSAGGQSRTFSPITVSAYETFVPTYAPAATRDTASEIQVSNGTESQADIQFREEHGHVISGTVTGAATSDGFQQYSAGVVVYDSQNRAEVGTASAISSGNFSFAVYGVMDGDYEISATQGSSTNDQLASPPTRFKVQGADVTGLRLTVAPLASIEGRVVFESDPKAVCAKRRASAMAETIINGRRYEPRSAPKDATADVPLIARTSGRAATVDARGVFSMKNLPPGTYQIDPAAPASGWYVRSVALDRNPAVNIARDGMFLKRGDRVNGLTVTFTEGAGQFLGHLSAAEGQSLPLKMRVYLVPEDRLLAANLYRFYETGANKDGSFTIDNIAPGKYLVIARRTEETESGAPKLVRLDEALRAAVLKEAEAQKKAVAFKPCEQIADFDLPLAPR
jgi:hypothetical protein